METTSCNPATIPELTHSSTRRGENHDSSGRSESSPEEKSSGRVKTPCELTDIVLKPPSCPMPRIEDNDHVLSANSRGPDILHPSYTDANEISKSSLLAEREEQSKLPAAHSVISRTHNQTAASTGDTLTSSFKHEEQPDKHSLTEADLLSTAERLPPEDDLAAPAVSSSHVGFQSHAVFSSAGGRPMALAAPPIPFSFVSPGGPQMAVAYRPVGSCQSGSMQPTPPIGHITCLPGHPLHPEQQPVVMAALGASARFFFPPRLFAGQIAGVTTQGFAPHPVMASTVGSVTPSSLVEEVPTQPVGQRRSASPRPGILRKRAPDGQSKASAKSTSMLSSSAENLSAYSAYTASPPVKKTRKQLITAIEDPLASNVPLVSSSKGNVDESTEPGPSTDGSQSAPGNIGSNAPATTSNGRGSKDGGSQLAFRRRMPACYGSGFRPNGKSVAHHFQRPGDVRVKEDRRPTLAEVRLHRSLMHDLHGWKLEHILENLSTIQKMEQSKLELVHYFQHTLPGPRVVPNDQKLHDELQDVWVLLQSSIERSKGMISQLSAVKEAIEKLRQNEPHVVELFNRFDMQKVLKQKAS